METTREEQRRARLTEIYRGRVEASYFDVKKSYAGNKRYAIINRETGDKLSEVSKRYCLVKNEDIFKPFVEKFGIENIRTFYGYGNRKYYHMRINTGRRFNFGTEENPDWIEEQIIVENSYNKTKSFTFMFGAFRWVCTNGLFSGNAQITYKKIHVGSIPVKRLVNGVINNYEKNSFETWKNLKDKPLTLDTQIKIIETFEAFALKEENKGQWDINHKILNRTKRYLEKDESVDNQRNGWGLYNQVNRAIAFEVSGDSNVSKRISANRKLETFLVKAVLN